MQALDRFLAGVERRALRMAIIATGNTDEALDIVQDAMLKLAQRYASRDAAEWGPLFQTIMHSTIMDWHRRAKVRKPWWQAWAGPRDDDEGGDPLDKLPSTTARDPAHEVGGERALVAIERALHVLPLRQQQAFLLRVWEGLDVAETARAMGCSEGSVKTHLSRAVASLRVQLEGHWP